MYVEELESAPNGYDVKLYDSFVENWTLVRAKPSFDKDSQWTAWDEIRFSDGEACVYERSYMKGKVVFVSGILASTALYNQDNCAIVRYILQKTTEKCRESVYPVQNIDGVQMLPVRTDNKTIWFVLAPSLEDRKGKPVIIKAPCNKYYDYWGKKEIIANKMNELFLEMREGLAILVECKQ